MTLSDKQLRVENRVFVNKLLASVKELVSKSRATYNWGPQKTRTEYFQKWHLRLNKGYLKQLEEASSFE